jgi:hypothetical protein
MEWLLFIAVIWLIGYSMGGKKTKTLPTEKEIRNNVRIELDGLANREKDASVAKGIRKAAEHVQPDPPVEPSQSAAAEVEPTPIGSLPSDPAEEKAPVKLEQPPRWLTTDIRNLDSVSILLYFGAFLMIAGVGLFVGLSDFDGTVKTIAVLLLALVFYGAGLYMYDKVERLRPASITLTAIGLICLPLTGVAAYAYWTDQTYGPVIWFFTSAICLLLYGLAIWRIRQSFIGYLSVFMCLSLWMSIVSVIEAPIYFFGWAAVILAMLYLLVAKRFPLWREIEMPLTTSASVMVPTALVMMLFFSADSISLLHKGITALLAAAFYGQATWLVTKASDRAVYFVLGNSLLQIGTVLIAFDITEQFVPAAIWLSAVAMLQVIIASAAKASMPAAWLTNLSQLTAIALTASAIMCAWSGDWVATSWLIGVHLVVHAFAALYLRSKAHMVCGLLAALVLPFMVGFMAFSPPVGRENVIAAYLILGVLLMLAARRAGRALPAYRHMTLVAYATAWVIAWLLGNLGGGIWSLSGAHYDWIPTATTLAVGILTAVSVYYEARPKLAYISATLAGLGTWQWLLLTDQTGNFPFAAFMLCTLGLAFYIAGSLQQYTRLSLYGQPWAWSGLTLIYLGSLYGIVGSMSRATPDLWVAAVYLLIAGGLTSYEAYRRSEKNGIYLGGAVMIVALQMMMYQLGIREWQLYWYMWALYPIAIAYLEKAPVAVNVGTAVMAVGVSQGLLQHQSFTLANASLIYLVLSLAYYSLGKAHAALSDEHWQPHGRAWVLSGIAGLYITAILPYFLSIGSAARDSLTNTLALMAAGGATSYEAYRLRSRLGLYVGGGVALLGLQWLMYLQDITAFQVYSHMWALYFGLLAWLSHRDNRLEEKQGLTIIALLIQSLPLAIEALGGNAGYGLLLLLESIALLVFGLLIRYPLVSRWGLAVAVASVLYQLREFEFFVLALLGAGVIGLGIFMLLRGQKK